MKVLTINDFEKVYLLSKQGMSVSNIQKFINLSSSSIERIINLSKVAENGNYEQFTETFSGKYNKNIVGLAIDFFNLKPTQNNKPECKNVPDNTAKLLVNIANELFEQNLTLNKILFKLEEMRND